MTEHKNFTSEYKLECIHLHLTQGYSQREIVKMMNVGRSSLQRWVSQYKKELAGNTPTAKALTKEQQYIQKLERENRQLKSDNDLLKKASAFFAQEINAKK